jgi:hypothetical protein
MKQVNFRVSEEMYALLASEADRVNQTPSAYAKQKIESHLTGGNAQIDRLSSSIEQLTHRVYGRRIFSHVQAVRLKMVLFAHFHYELACK